MDIIKKQNLEGNIWKILLFHALANLSFAAPIMVLFWQENGLTLKEAMVLQSIFSFCIVVLEIPTGYFADVFGRKKSLIYSAFFMVFGYLFYSLGHDFYQFLIAEITIAFAISFLSGADSAMVYDTLKDVQKEKDFKKIWGNILFYSLIAAVFASIVGGFIAKINFRWTLYLEFLLIIPAIPLAFTLMEPKRHMIIFKKGYLLELFKVIKSSVLKNEKIKWLIIYSGFIVGFNWAALWLYQPYFKLSGIDIAYFGIVFAAFNAVAAISSKYSHRIEKYFGQKRSLTLLMFLLGAS